MFKIFKCLLRNLTQLIALTGCMCVCLTANAIITCNKRLLLEQTFKNPLMAAFEGRARPEPAGQETCVEDAYIVMPTAAG